MPTVYPSVLTLNNTASGDLSGSYPDPTVATVGTKSATLIATSVNDTTAATDANTVSTIVKRGASGAISVAGITATSLNLSGGALANFIPNTRTVSGGTGILASTDLARIVYFTSASSVTLTIPSGLGAGFHCLLVQEGAGQVNWVASSSTIVQRNGYVKTAGTGSIMTVVAGTTTNLYYLMGDGV
jgi:hypothetical protein